jgi:histidinol-phosphate/aromatic aminotransferase/cobyric acid decarboxylase-like protein
VARTFSKIYGMAGMRLGYAVTTETNAKALRAQSAWATERGRPRRGRREPRRPGPRRAAERLNGTRRRLCDALARDGRRIIPSRRTS